MAQANFHVCYHCKDRALGCHAKCEAYLKEQQEYQRERQQRRKEKWIDDTLRTNQYKRVRSLKQGK